MSATRPTGLTSGVLDKTAGHICGDHPAPCNHDPAHTEGGA